MEALRAELEACTSLPALRRFHDRLTGLQFFDPACGCGNFLIIAYRELRRLELELLRRIRARQRNAGQLGLEVSWESRIHVGQFYGIKIEEFPARIAETAMYLIDHLELVLGELAQVAMSLVHARRSVHRWVRVAAEPT